MEVMSSLLLCAFLALLPQALGEFLYNVSDLSEDVVLFYKLYSIWILQNDFMTMRLWLVSFKKDRTRIM